MTSPARAPRPTPRRLPNGPRPQPRTDLRLAPEPSRRRRTKFSVMAAVLVVFGSLLTSAIFYSGLVSGQLRLDRVDHRVEVERAALRREQARLADLQSPARIAKSAAERGMIPADPVYWVSPGTGAAPVATGPAAASTSSTTVPTATIPSSTVPASTSPSATTSAGTAGRPDTAASANR